MQYDDPALLPLCHEVDDVWMERVAANQPLGERTYYGGGRLVPTANLFYALGWAFSIAVLSPRISLCQRLSAPLRPTDETRNTRCILRMCVVSQRRQPQIAPYQLDESHPRTRIIFRQRSQNVCLQSVRVTPDHIQ
uniref:Uncharacterized protein n=1 Tax=Romanomermis culicivorax TaxID=13658 RepID=A0A915LBM9_ROMCU